MIKPRVRFCWDCGRKLWGNHHVVAEIDGHERVLHKECHRKMFPDAVKVKKASGNISPNNVD